MLAEPAAMKGDLLERVDLLRLDASRKLKPERRSSLGQFLTPAPIARLMASMLDGNEPSVRLLDPGAGVGSLCMAAVLELCSRPVPPECISVTVCEIDEVLASYLPDTLELCRLACLHAGVAFSGEVIRGDFIELAANRLAGYMFTPSGLLPFNCIILNPPYKKLQHGSSAHRLLSRIGIETTNLYTAFLSISTRLLEPAGDLVAIVPRSFANGTYFEAFRKSFLRDMALYRLHLFESRQAAFQEDDVLQENIIMHARKETETPARVVISSSNDPSDDAHSWREVDYSQVIDPTDERSYIHIVADELGQQIAERINTFHSTLADLGLTVSTGRVVDFRATKYLRAMPGEDTAPLIYPTHFASGYVSWPKDDSKKPNALVYSPETSNLFVPNEDYVLVKRFSSKEEKRRLVGAIYDASRVAAPAVGFENHLNYYHRNGHGLDMMLARGLAAYLNSTLLDVYFRQFSGHTQVNATDLRNIKYPTLEQLRVLGSQLPDGETVDQDTIDRLLEEELQRMADTPTQDPLPTVRRIAEAKDIIARLGFPAQQQNDRSALTLLALLDLPANKPWSDARQPLRGITQIMDWFAEAYGKRYAPNSRETVRRQTVHQFVEAGLLIPNPDQPDRPINSGETVYMVEDSALELLRSFNSENWEQNVAAYNATRQTLAERYSQERKMTRISVALPSGEGITLSPGGQNVLVKEIIEQFGPRYTPGGKVLYVGDTDKKFALIDRETLAELGVKIDEHGKMPDIILYHVEKGWLILIEAVTSHGPINPKRRGELRGLFADCTVGLVYATAFLDRRTMKEYLPDISWETEVWVADSPDHLIHFDGERFLGPYEE